MVACLERGLAAVAAQGVDDALRLLDHQPVGSVRQDDVRFAFDLDGAGPCRAADVLCDRRPQGPDQPDQPQRYCGEETRLRTKHGTAPPGFEKAQRRNRSREAKRPACRIRASLLAARKMPEDHDITRLLALARGGEPGPMNAVFEALYPELRRLANSRMLG